LRYGTRNIERRAVGSDTCASASTASENGPSRQRPPHRGGGHPVDRPHRSALARSTGGVWPLAKHRHPLLPLGRGRGVGPCPRRAPETGRRRTRSRLEPPSHRWDLGKGAPACGGSEKRGSSHNTAAPPEKDPQTKEALGRSRGGFSTKIHLRAEVNGKPITFLITAGQCHEQSVLECLRGSFGAGRGQKAPARTTADTPREGGR
jgi:hypothetical protein